MKVEFFTNSSVDTGCVMAIQESEFKKAKNNRTELDNLIFAVDAFNKSFGMDVTFSFSEYKDIEKQLKKGGTVIFSVTKEDQPSVYVSNNGVPEQIKFSPQIRAIITR